jgi:uncharacterized protein (DUF2336 family)
MACGFAGPSVFMTAATSLFPELEEIVREGDPRRLADVARRIAELFAQGAENFRPDHVDLFDRVLIDLAPHTEIPARAELAEQMAAFANAPRTLVGQLARDDEISIAGPLLRRSPVLEEQVLVEIARIKGQAHLLALTERPQLSPDLTEVIVRRGDRDVVRRAAANAGALFSQAGYSTLVRRAGKDTALTLTVGQRDDLPDQVLRELLAGSAEIIRRRLSEAAKPARKAAIGRAMSEISGEAVQVGSRRDFAPAQRAILALHRTGDLNEAALLRFAKAYRYEESVAALSAMSGVQIATLDRLMAGERHDPVLLVGKAVGLGWATVRALIMLRLGPARMLAPADIEDARSNFMRLMPSTAERVVNFWRIRQSA